MGQAAGGDVVRMGQGEVALPTTIPNRLGRGIFVNRQGLRFINEDTYYGHIGIESLFRQDGRVYLLLDDATYERGLLGLEATLGRPRASRSSRPRRACRAARCEATLAFYNRHAARGEDPLFHKRARAGCSRSSARPSR